MCAFERSEKGMEYFMKKVRIFLLIILIITLLIILCAYLYKTSGKKNFEDLIQYKTSSVSDEKNLNKILRNLEFADFIIRVEKQFNDNKEQLYIYYDCTDENEIRQYNIDFHKMSLIEKNAVKLFALIDNLEQITFNFTISNMDYVREHHMASFDNKFDDTKYVYTRERIEKNYNQDVRNYIREPDEFMNYNIDLDIEKITIYCRDEIDYNAYNAIEIEDINVINNISENIKNKNFGVPDDGYNGMCNTWVDLNNGYIIGVYGEGYDGYCAIAKGNGKDIFKLKNTNMDQIVHKQLPEGLEKYIENLIKESRSLL